MQKTPGTSQNGANGSATTVNDDDEIRILPSSPANRTFNSNQPITSQVPFNLETHLCLVDFRIY